MTIKEIEAKSGMTRANIRFYEAEGFIEPKRQENGYRDYSDYDLEVLIRIKLLRSLKISLEDIKKMQNGKQRLVDTLDQHIKNLILEKAELDQSQKVCAVMKEDGVQYQTLDARHYLDVLEQMTNQPVLPLSSDVIKEPRVPIRRFFARVLDFNIVLGCWNAFQILVMNVNLSAQSAIESLISGYAAWVLVLFIEPLLLSFFGTTIGKGIMGIRVVDEEGNHLSYGSAFLRTATVIMNGMGANIPIYGFYRMWKCLNACMDEKRLAWEEESSISLKNGKEWGVVSYICHFLVYSAVYAGVIGLVLSCSKIAEMPQYRGEITVAQFSANYNRYADYYKINSLYFLDEQGNWVQDFDKGMIIDDDQDLLPEMTFLEDENGAMSGVIFTVECSDNHKTVFNYQNEMVLSVLSFVKAQDGNTPFSNEEIKKVIKIISDSPFKSYEISSYGIDIRCDVSYEGYMDTAASGMLIPAGDEETHFVMTFSMQKQ